MSWPVTDKEFVIDAICGAGVPFSKADHFTRAGLAQFTGHQHAESWHWRRERLQELEVPTLEALYAEIKTSG